MGDSIAHMDDDVTRALTPLLQLGLLKRSDLGVMATASRQEREARFQALFMQAIETRQRMRKICAECGKSGETVESKLKVCSKCGNIW